MKTIGDAKAALNELRPRYELYQSAAFQDLVKEIETELKAMDVLALSIGKEPNTAQRHLMNQLSFDPPQSHEETLRLYFAIRGVVSFWERKLGRLKSQSEKYKELEKQIANDGRASVNTRRTVGTRIR